MARDLYVARLKAVPLFAQLSKKELAMLVRQADHIEYPEGFVVIREGQSGNEFWLVISGTLSVQRGGDEVDTLGSGDWFGELAVIDPAPRDATIVATSPVELMVIGRQRFWATLEGSTSLMRKVIIGLAHRLREMDAADAAERRSGSDDVPSPRSGAPA
jgi:CRP/FNR family cyclic AMP-dependent transcriptional regulator